MKTKLNEHGRKDLSGLKSGRLVAIRYEYTRNKKAYWLCLCDCGKSKIVVGTSITNGHVKSCGCLKKEMLAEKNFKHGFCGTGLYQCWQDMKKRCYDKNRAQYKDWGGRGISVCEDWLSFENFKIWAVKNGYQPGLTIERVDNNGNYSPENCKFIRKQDQNSNRRNTVVISFDGKNMNIEQWAKYLGLKRGTFDSRLKRGWSIEKAITTTITQTENRKAS